MYHSESLVRIERQIVSQIEDELNRVGAFYRIFARIKDIYSLQNKFNNRVDGYYDGKTKFVRDVIGVRIVFYFVDDIGLIRDFLRNRFVLLEEMIDPDHSTIFAPKRLNLVFKLPDPFKEQFRELVKDVRLDPAFEVQLRSILSEGWHEVDHDLRYKCLSYWNDHSDLERSFNGILATLETSDYTTIKLFDELAYRHYKTGKFEALLKTKFRLRFINEEISENLLSKISGEFARSVFKLDRIAVLRFMLENWPVIPLNLDNFIKFINFHFIKDDIILAAIDETLKEHFVRAISS